MNGTDSDRLAMETARQFSQVKTMLIVVSTIGLVTLAVGGATLFLVNALTAAAAGTEPPIRVKGGSIHFDAITPPDENNAQWEPDATGGWALVPGDRNTKKFGLMIVASTACPAVSKGNDDVVVTYTDDTDTTQPKDYVVKFVAKVKGSKFKTNVTPPTGLTLYLDPKNGRDLSNVQPSTTPTSPTGYVSHIVAGGVDCKFARGEFDEAIIFEW
jgi:hypothetical protein